MDQPNTPQSLQVDAESLYLAIPKKDRPQHLDTWIRLHQYFIDQINQPCHAQPNAPRPNSPPK